MLRFKLDILPPKATAQTQKTSFRGGFVTKYDTPQLAKARALLTEELKKHRPGKPLAGCLKLFIRFTFPWRKNESKKVRAQGWKFCDVRPDYDNLVKLPQDIMTRQGYWYDDSQIVHGTIIKGWGDKPGIEIKITEIE